MLTVMTRTEYDESLGRHLGDFAQSAAGLVDLAVENPAAWAREIFVHQYPKLTSMAVVEMRYRGVTCPVELPPRDWTAGEVDGVVILLEALGYLTDEAQQAAAAGVSLAKWRRQSNVVSD